MTIATQDTIRSAATTKIAPQLTIKFETIRSQQIKCLTMGKKMKHCLMFAQ